MKRFLVAIYCCRNRRYCDDKTLILIIESDVILSDWNLKDQLALLTSIHLSKNSSLCIWVWVGAAPTCQAMPWPHAQGQGAELAQLPRAWQYYFIIHISYMRPFKSFPMSLHLSRHICHTVCVFYLDLSLWIKKSNTCFLWFITHFIQSIKVNIVPSHTDSLAFQSRYVCFSTIKSCCNLQLLPLINFSSLFHMEEEVAVKDAFKTASSAQKSLIWKYYLISTMKNTATHCHHAKCCYCNVVMDGKVQQCIQKHMLNCEKVGHEDKAHLYCHLSSLPTLP